MARRRMIDPNFWQSEDISKLTLFERYLFVGMFSNADDEGKGRANINYLKSIIFPYDEIRTADVDKALFNIAHNTSVVFYEVADSKYYLFTKWSKWQRVDKPQLSIIPDFTEYESHSKNDSKNGSKNDSGVKEVNIKEVNIKEEKKNKDIVNVPFAEIIIYLNTRAKTGYRHTTKSTKELIQARFNDNFTLENFKTVIDKKCTQWIGTTDEMYLRPETLFGNKFEGYLNQNIIKPKEKLSIKNNFEGRNYTQKEMDEIERKVTGN